MTVDFLVSNLCEFLYNMAKEELARQMGLVDDVQALLSTLEELQIYLLDAEKKSIDDNSTNRWLLRIKDAVYDIEDVLEEYALEIDEESIGNQKLSSSSRIFNKVRSKFKKVSDKRRISIQIQDLVRRLKEIMDQIPRLGLMRSMDCRTGCSQISSAHMAPPFVDRSDIVGRRVHDDGRHLLKLMTKEDHRDNPLVYAIVGIGGIGKTTLAKLVFDDNIIKSHFDVKVWASISQNCSNIDILRTIIGSAGSKEERGQDQNLLCEKFKDMVNGKSVFMVLDDVWEAENVWNPFLKGLLKSCVGRGSRVLVTTRNIEVTKKMMAVHSHSMELLSVEDGWLLLRKASFPSWEQDEAGDDAWGLKDVGIEFVNKCNGLPLAIKAIGGILSAESRTRDAWASVLKNSLWEVKGLPPDIHRALYLSYLYLPSNIKQCFLYFSLIPKGNILRFSSITASEQWMQEGFIKEEDNLSVYEVGESYLRLLVRRNLLMSVTASGGSFVMRRSLMPYGESNFYMHDLLRSLSQFLVQNESRLVSNEEELLKIKSSGRQMKLRRFSYTVGDGKKAETLPKSLTEQVSLRTLLIFGSSISRIESDLFNHLRRLRILSFMGTSIEELPPSVGALMQLRYLNLANTQINELPTTIGNLKNLRVLIISGCKSLKNLPPCIMNLHRLRTLATSESSLTHLPPNLGRLRELQRLDFILPIENIGGKFSSLEDLAELKQLRMLTLNKLERAVDPSKVRIADIKGKHHLETLKLTYSESEFASSVERIDSKFFRGSTNNNAQLYSPEAEEIADKVKDVFEELCPATQLRKLYINGNFGHQLPSWLSSSPPNSIHVNLRYILLWGCNFCKKFPGLGLLPNLEELHIGSTSSVGRIDSEFYRGSTNKNEAENVFSGPFFPRLKLLRISGMKNLKEWTSPGECISTMPRLETLIIFHCNKLESLPEDLLCHATSLKKVVIKWAEKLHLKVVYNDSCLEVLVIQYIGHLERISGLPSLQKLTVINCPGLNAVDVMHPLDKLIWMDIYVETLPGWLSADNLRASFLEISCNERLARKICSEEDREEDGRQEFAKIQHYDNISVQEGSGLLRLTYTKNPYSFTVHPPLTA